MSCLPPKRMEFTLYQGDANLAGEATLARNLYVMPGSPLVWSHVAIYFRGDVQGQTESHGDAADRIDIHSFVRDPKQGRFALNSIQADATFPLAWEGVTAADGIRFNVTQRQFEQHGQIVAVVTFYPAQPMSSDMWKSVVGDASATADPTLLQLVSA